ncbi:MAG: hypothetical protein M3033_08965 [Acidobacteriota bacterium]|nr:hypothetical protein [Acidobacteriota bacterium]
MNLMSKNNERTIEKIIYLMQTDRSAEAPDDSIHQAKNIFRARVAQPKKTLVEKVLAVLQLDLRGAKPAFGERSGASTNMRQMLFQAGDNNTIDLRIKAGENNFALQGQVLGKGFAGCTVKLGEFETKTNEMSEFKFNDIASGNYNLILLSGKTEITIENLELN